VASLSLEMGYREIHFKRARSRKRQTEDDMDQSDRHEQVRDSTRIVAVVFLCGGVGLLLVDIALFGGSLLALAAAITICGAVHYLVWGHALTQEVAPEREALLRQEETGEPPLTQAPADAIQDLERKQGIRKK